MVKEYEPYIDDTTVNVAYVPLSESDALVGA
jgi:hypothetical protein